MVPWFLRIYKEPALPCVTHNKMDNVTINVLDSKDNVVMLTVHIYLMNKNIQEIILE